MELQTSVFAVAAFLLVASAAFAQQKAVEFEAFPIGMKTLPGFGLGFGICVSSGHIGELGWGGAASTHFWISPRDEVIVVAMSQYRPYSDRLVTAVRPIVYDAIKE